MRQPGNALPVLLLWLPFPSAYNTSHNGRNIIWVGFHFTPLLNCTSTGGKGLVFPCVDRVARYKARVRTYNSIITSIHLTFLQH